MEGLGRQCIIEYYGCPTEVMNNLELIERAVTSAAKKMGSTVVTSAFHRFNPLGVSGMVVVSDSHLSIHTWPDLGYAAVDIFTSDEVIDPWVVHTVLRDAFGATDEAVVEFRRGTGSNPGGLDAAARAAVRSFAPRAPVAA